MKILLYADDSAYWHTAARLVSKLAHATGAHVTVVTTAWLSTHRRKALEEAERILELQGDQISTWTRPGLVEYVIPEVVAKEQPDLVVIGRLSGLDRLTSGLVSILLLRRIRSSLLLVRPHLKDVSKILVCTQGPRHGGENFRQALRAAEAFGAELTVLHVLSQIGMTATASESLKKEASDFLATEGAEAEHLRDLLAQMKAAGVRGEVKVRRGLVVDEILDETREGHHDLLVIGAHEGTGVENLLYEDLASLIVRSSAVSTLIIRTPATPGNPPSAP